MKTKTPKKKNKQKNSDLLAALGKGYREAYLLQNPHGFKKQTTITKDKTKYNRKGQPKADPFLFKFVYLYLVFSYFSIFIEIIIFISVISTVAITSSWTFF